ncbi:MAG: hypothetical protein A2031_08015 [Deltaproteobacteria bacterium RBG_19FT_COMBO_43_11]|nr:MAG: hypothetical protein A2031_08015 [Deltaproteobacteria bacterium RBG_19FT_COMBO_43_11]
MDFNSLVNEILQMAKDSQEERRKKAEGNPNISWDNTPAGESYWKDIRARNSALEVGKQNDVGTMARQRLAGESAANVADITAGAHRYTADMGLKGRETDAQAKIDAAIGAAELKRKDPAIDFVHATIAADPSIATDITRDKDTGKTRMEILMENAGQLNPKKDKKRISGTDFVQPDVAPGGNPPVTPVSAPPPARASLTGGQSMEFRSGLSPEEEERRKKESEARMFYGTKPQSRSWLPSF